MNSKMTPCEMLGYKVGDEFEVISHYAFKKGQVVTLHEDDGTECPLFSGDGGGACVFDGVECSFATLNKQVRKIANKLKPAKQALAGAIHQNGGWRGGKYAVYGKHSGKCSFLTCKPQYLAKDHGWFVMLSWIVGEFEMKPFINWHQCILSRDEYFTAYPEQVKVEICNETKHKVEVEMESESEMTIKVSDWHKNGELPPVGEVCEWLECKKTGWQEVIVAGYYMNAAWIVPKGKEPITVFNPTGFRPRRTEREKAIDEMVEVLKSAIQDTKTVHKICASALYNAGYRKEVK